MGVNKNFVVKYGLEVGLSTDGLQYALLSDFATRNVGIGTSVPKFKLHVSGGIGATFLNVTGISSVVDIRGTRLNYSGIGTIATFNANNAFVNTGVTTTLSGVALNYSGISTVQLCSGDSVVYRQGYINVGLVTNLRGTNVEYTGIATFNQTYINVGVVTDAYIFREYTQTGIVTTLTGTDLNYTGVGTVVALRGTNLNYTGVGTITTLDGTTADFNTLYSNTGIVTTIGITTANITNAYVQTDYVNTGIITTAGITSAFIGNAFINTGIVTTAGITSAFIGNAFINSGIVTTAGITSAFIGNAFINSGIVTTAGITSAFIGNAFINTGIVTTLTGTNLNYTGVGTFAALRGTNLNYSGIGTIVTLDGTTADFNTLYSNTGIVTTIGITTANITNAYVQAGYVNLGIITAIQGTNINVGGITTSNSYNIGANQVISSARQLQNIASVDATTNNTILSIVGGGSVAGQTVTGVATFTNGPVLIGTGTSTGTVEQRLQVIGGAYVSGNTGIGTTNPQSQLHITGQFQSTRANNASFGQGQIYLNGANGNRIDFAGVGTAPPSPVSQSVGTRISLAPAAGTIGYSFGIDTDTLWSSVPSTAQQFKWYSLNTNIATLFGTGELVVGTTTKTGTASQPLQVTGGAYVSGNVGIGITLPTQRLDVQGGVRVVGVVTATTFSGSGSGLNSIPNGALTNSTISGIALGSNLATLTINSTYLTGTSYNGSGAVTLNINASDASTNSFIVARNATGGFSAGIITCTDLNSTSDANLKTNVQPIANALDIATSLEGVRFEWKDTNKPSLGVIAQQIEEVLPELVSTGDNKTVNYNGLIGVLIEAIKELKAEVDELKSNSNK